MARHADLLPPDWERISVEWRQKQLEYSWVDTLSGTGHHRDLWQITKDSLAFVAARHRITDHALLRGLLDAYRHLPAYPDAAPTLAALRGAGLRTAILSNGEPGMLHAAVKASGLEPMLDAVLSVEALGVFKPDPRVYTLAEQALGLPAADMGFVSGNAWDAQAAVAAGFRVFWCNRVGQPEEYGLHTSAKVLSGLAELAAFVVE